MEELSHAEKLLLHRQLHGEATQRDQNVKDPSRLSFVLAFASPAERLALGGGCLCCIVGGALNPLLTVIYGQLVKTFQLFTNGDIQGPVLSSQVARFSLYFVYLAIAMFAFIYAATVIFFLCGEAITRRLRLAYLRSVLCQNMAFFDLLGSGTVTTSLTSDINLVHDALSAKISLTLTAAATCLTALIITFVMSWRLALVLTASTVAAMVLANSLGTRFAVRYNRRALDAAARSNAMVEEALRSYKHAAAFGIQRELENRYASHLQRARHHSLRARCVVALTMTAFMTIMYLSSGLSFWQGSRFLVTADISASSVVTCSMAVLISALTVSKVAPNAQAFVSGINGSDRLGDCVRRRSPMDPMDASGKTPSSMLGRLELNRVRLVYPSRPDRLALRGVDMVFSAGKMTAVIGASGCGKSSIVGLVERFYMPTSGSISLDHVDIQDLNLHWLRQHIALVSQEPVLFKGSVFDNIRYGLIGKLDTSDTDPHIISEIQQRVEDAAKTANAHEFISQLPQGYGTDVGEMGGHLSGGQRQRIAIARAIIGNPRILFLDEATAALDSKSEHIVLDALQRASVGRTTIFITHRLSSIRDADQIIVMSDGQVLETGTHETLVGREHGPYARMLDKQRLVTLQATPDLTGTHSAEHLHARTISDLSQTMGHDEKRSQPEEDVMHSRVEPKDESTRPAAQAPYAIELSREHKTATPRDESSMWSLIKMAMSLNRPELPLVLTGLVCCLTSGALIPVQSLFFANNIVALSLPPSQYTKLRSDVNFWSLMYLVLGLVALVSWGGQGFCLALCSERLVYRARTRAFKSILRQDISFFDRPVSSAAESSQDRQHKNTTGSLMNVLSSSATHLAGLGGAVLSTVLTAFATLAGGIILSLVIGWKLALVCTATVPIVLVCGWLRLRVLNDMEAQTKAAYADSAAFAGEAIASIRTVAALCMEEHILASYESIVDRTALQNRRSILISSSLYAASQSVVFLVAALGFWYGGSLIADHSYTMLQYFVCFAALVSGSQSVGAVFSFAPDMSRAIHGAEDFRRLFDATPTIDVWSEEGVEMEKAQCQGALELHNVTFSYDDGHEASEHASAMPPSTALRNFSLKIAPKQTVALVGHSGCGKSTIISLLERFIDPDAGAVTLDGVDIRDLNLSKYRSLLSLVGQETFLYQGSIRDNLLLGVGRTAVSQEEIDGACAQANILEFLRGLPDGYETEVGSRGIMLSGGQKQRIAIARALLRNSPILLLDEATSALDGDSEQAVQSALDAARQSRTTIVVAHRLKSVQDADLICVIERGAIAEMGTHGELMRADSKYASMVQLQSLEE